MPSRHTPLQRRSWISRRLLRLIACGHLAALALACMTASAQAGTADARPEPERAQTRPVSRPASRPTAVAPSGVACGRAGVDTVTDTGPDTTAGAAYGRQARVRIGGASEGAATPAVAGGSRDGAGSHTPRRTIERPKGSFASAVGKANGSARTALRTVSPLELGVAATLLALLALAGFSLAASVVRLEGKG